MTDLYTERYGKRAPLKKTYAINRDVYSLLLDCCVKYKKNLIHMFFKTCQDYTTRKDYIDFNENSFNSRINIRIPALYRNDFDRICVPFEDDEYDQYALLDLIEFFSGNIKDTSKRWNDNRYHNYEIIECFETSNIFKDFQVDINQIFTEAGLLYILTDNKKIERIVEYGPLTEKIENIFTEVHEEGLNKLIEDAIALFKTPNPKARKDSVEKLWDALERLKTYYAQKSQNKKNSINTLVSDMAKEDSYFIDIFNQEFTILTEIGNKYRIRHHETYILEFSDDRYYDYLFNRCLSLIALAIQYLH